MTLVNEVERLQGNLKHQEGESSGHYQKLQSQERSMNGLEGKVRDYENRLGIMSEEIERQHTVIKSRNDEVEQWKQRNGKLELQVGNMRQLEAKLSEYENRIQLMSQEIERLNYQIKGRSEELGT